MNIFSRKPKPKEALRECKREMANATRGIEKEIHTLQLEEKRLVAEIKRTAKTGNEAMSAQTSVAVGIKGAGKAMAVMNKLSSAPKGKIAGKNVEDVGSSNIDELEKRLAALRNP
ncbi:Vacuolar protein sorting-associated protein 23 [Sesamum angolense]|uniref:Vacuolar protein sorting-associated protein 23 n=1 Tax=Sesamum angolense TaxID=2727404 RepID=A0AAE1X9D1_9LAMI|nr:Vacuolar protein sorting-associated protein 23 [Sesamum angolense]